MKVIKWSSKKFGQLEILVDDEDYDRLIQYSWGVLKCKTSDTLYVKARYVSKEQPRKYYSIHRFILGIDDPKIFVDHRDGNGLNNQKSNLRIATNRDNCRNRGKQKNNTSGFKGVVVVTARQGVPYKTPSYIVAFHIREGADRKCVFRQTFKDPVIAALKYNELARQYHGEFAYQNPV